MADSRQPATGPGVSPAAPEPLATTLARPLDVGSNLRGLAGGGTLAYVLPTLAPDHIACLGRPAPSVLETLRRLAVDGRVSLVDGGSDPAATGVAAGGPADVLWIAGASGLDALADPGPAVAALLATAGVVVVDDVSEAALPSIVARLRTSGHAPTVLATTWADGIVRTAEVRREDAAPPTRPAALRHRLTRLRTTVPRGGRGRRDGLAVLAVPGGADRPPAWLLEQLEAVDVETADRTWRLASPGVYDSQKVLIALSAETDGDGLIAKITRDTRHNGRLATEAEALSTLATIGPIEHLAIPRIVASGPVGPLFVVVETMIDGQPLPGVLRRAGGGPSVARAVDGLISLAVVTARPVAGTALAAAFATLMERYVALHQPPTDARRALERSLDSIAAAGTIPVVAQHGDPGTWNMLAMPDGRVGVLDWEAFEPAGPPLWDLWHLLRSVLLDVRRSSLPRRRSSILGAAFLTGGDGSDLVADATARYRRAIDLDPGLVVPLFAFGWLHRALKESTRSRPADVGAGHYARLMASVIADLDAPGLRRLSERDRA